MKKVLVVLALCVPFAAMLAVNIPADQVIELGNLPEITQPLVPEEIELKEDEAIPLPWSLRLSAGDRLAVKLTPPSYPFGITQAAYAPWDEQYDQECKLIFYEDGGTGPGSEMDSKNVAAATPQIFNWFDVTDLNLSIESGSFYCAVELLVNTYPYFIYDSGEPLHHASWFYPTSAGQWYPWENVSVITPEGDTVILGEVADMMIRVRGNVVGIGEVELGPGGVVIMPSATIVASESSVNYTLPEAGNIDISLWDALGRPVKTLYTGHADAGEHTLTWDASGLPRGAYFLKLKTANTVSTAKIVLID
ncbi:MAG: T9SS type A sorting domain-containing protein [candidate division WOR-3 bacterium]|nr:T9SS type A sorting domain-containing protein [candidate division WOR-3 bacterium]